MRGLDLSSFQPLSLEPGTHRPPRPSQQKVQSPSLSSLRLHCPSLVPTERISLAVRFISVSLNTSRNFFGGRLRRFCLVLLRQYLEWDDVLTFLRWRFRQTT